MRAQRTRLEILARTVNVAVVIITVSLIMLNIPGVRDVGTAMLASAGLAALAVGAASVDDDARRSLTMGTVGAVCRTFMRGQGALTVDVDAGRADFR